MTLVRSETAADHDGIRVVNQLAFDGPAEAALVDRLRADGVVIVSIVALKEGRLIGHVLFSKVAVNTAGGTITAAALAPVAVHPEWQRRGVGGDLIRAGLECCREAGTTVVLVLGHPDYYRRFGFTAEAAKSVASPWSHLGEPWMALELVPGALAGVTGTAVYPEAFFSEAPVQHAIAMVRAEA